MTLSLDTAYRSFGGEVEASSTPTICRLPDSRRHQLSAIAPISHQTTVTAMRLSTVMKQLGWQRHKNGYVSIPNHDRVKGYFRALSEDDLYARRALELQRPGERFHQPPQP